ncbi:MAG TPA: SAM-dependent chlorinase/fluorinase [Thermoanaerobaculia bacterium]|jgi:S-adenosylmethionine hydrolase|nr:SAM-dependent chlorinase/fluorinase [Thermoanaerobaculia bacterium]
MVIALLTDFGTRDPYVAAMKGVIASRTEVAVVDLTHEIAPFDVWEGAWFLRNVVAYWPAGTVFVCVVDPGVGTSRRIIAMEREGRMLLAPDNGLLTFVASDVVCAIENASLFLPNGSNTFHGRDRFAPVAAAIANGLRLEELGPRIEKITVLEYEEPTYSSEEVRGTVMAIDRFGNVITDIDPSRVSFAIPRLEVNYGDAAPGAFHIVGSAGTLEISIANGNAAEELQMKRRQRVELRPL